MAQLILDKCPNGSAVHSHKPRMCKLRTASSLEHLNVNWSTVLAQCWQWWLGGTVDQLTSGGLLSARPCGQRADSPELGASWHLGGYVAALNLTGAGTGRLAPVWSIGRLESEAV